MNLFLHHVLDHTTILRTQESNLGKLAELGGRSLKMTQVLRPQRKWMSMKKSGAMTLFGVTELRKKAVEDRPDDESMELSALQ